MSEAGPMPCCVAFVLYDRKHLEQHMYTVRVSGMHSPSHSTSYCKHEPDADIKDCILAPTAVYCGASKLWHTCVCHLQQQQDSFSSPGSMPECYIP